MLVLVESKQITVSDVGVPMYGSTTALRQLLRSEGNEAHVVRISPKGYTLVNGVDYCYVGLKSKDGTDYSVQAYGKEAIELYEQAVNLRY
ncbi:MAG: hypothetical protein EHM25_02810 [Nitrosopumilales archaeon]|nr:MAG: hypothetical protein EHM25_12815 [Nitrosopumilales archaeon]RPJ31475.1 MAG: hypothetical protein EHM25_02810 [Nitrosopumilales archaeon]